MFRFKISGWLIAACLLAAGIFTPVSAKTIHVPKEHATIQSAIDAAESGDIVVVDPGTYKERIQLKTLVTVKSAGDETKGKLGLNRAEKTIIDGNFQDAKGAAVEMAEGSTLDGFTVTGVGDYDDALWNKHHATQGEEQSYDHIGEPGTAGISAIGVTCTIANNIVHHIGYSGIASQGVKGKRCAPHVYRNICYRNMGGGIASMQQSTARVEENICFENFYAGIGHANAHPTVINNICYANIRAGIGISEGSCPIVRGNKCYKNRRAGIGIRTGSSTRPVVEDNECYENDMAGIGTREGAAPSIRNNRCYKNKLAGIGSRTKATPVIIGNECYENGKAGIGQQSDAVSTVMGNYVHHNKTAGIGFAACESGQSLVTKNRIIDNEMVGVGIHSGWTVHLAGNEISRKGGLPPIVMVFEGADATFTDNVIRGGGVAGIRVGGTIRAEANVFAGTSLRRVGPPNFAIWALPGSDVTMSGNKVSSWRHALHATEATVSASSNQVNDFASAAFVVNQPTRPADVYENKAISSDSNVKLLALKGAFGLVRDNQLLPTAELQQNNKLPIPENTRE